jgi:hypothetical protein
MAPASAEFPVAAMFLAVGARAYPPVPIRRSLAPNEETAWFVRRSRNLADEA